MNLRYYTYIFKCLRLILILQYSSVPLLMGVRECPKPDVWRKIEATDWSIDTWRSLWLGGAVYRKVVTSYTDPSHPRLDKTADTVHLYCVNISPQNTHILTCVHWPCPPGTYQCSMSVSIVQNYPCLSQVQHCPPVTFCHAPITGHQWTRL